MDGKKGNLRRLDSGNIPKVLKKPLFLGAKGLGFITHTEYLKSGHLNGNNCGMLEIDSKYLSIDIKDEENLKTWRFF